MVHPNRTVQLLALGGLVALYVVQVVFGRPDPRSTFRNAYATYNGIRREAD
jgi:hypothetical protein